MAGSTCGSLCLAVRMQWIASPSSGQLPSVARASTDAPFRSPPDPPPGTANRLACECQDSSWGECFTTLKTKPIVLVFPLAYPLAGGSAVYLDALVNVIGQHAPRILIICSHTRGVPRVQISDRATYLRILPQQGGNVLGRLIRGVLRYGLLLPILFRNRKALIHIHNSLATSSVVFALGLMKAQFVIDVRDITRVPPPGRARAIIAASEEIRSRVPPTVPLSVLPLPFAPTVWALQQSWSPPSGPPVITFVGSMSVGKGLDLLIGAFRLLRSGKLPQCELHLIGPAGDHRVPYIDGVHFLGSLPHTTTLEQIRMSSLLVHPARHELVGRAVLEAAIIGTPFLFSGSVPLRRHFPRNHVEFDEAMLAEAIHLGISKPEAFQARHIPTSLASSYETFSNDLFELYKKYCASS